MRTAVGVRTGGLKGRDQSEKKPDFKAWWQR